MAWQRKVAHQITRGYLCRHYNIDRLFLIKDPKISELAFFNPNLSDELRRNEMRIVTGNLLAFCTELNLELEADGKLDETFTKLVDLLTPGAANSSEIGVLVDQCFKCVDED